MIRKQEQDKSEEKKQNRIRWIEEDKEWTKTVKTCFSLLDILSVFSLCVAHLRFLFLHVLKVLWALRDTVVVTIT